MKLAEKPAWVLSGIVTCVLMGSCTQPEPASTDLYGAVDALHDGVAASIDPSRLIVSIDHSRLAAEQGEIMPPARVIMFSDPIVNTAILQQEPSAGLDLPYRVLAYAEGDAPAVLFTTADYLKQRYGLADGRALRLYEEGIAGVASSVPDETVVALDASSFSLKQGIATLKSDYGFDETIDRLKSDIMKETDTVWFGDIDYREEAAVLGVELPKLTLLLFGAPGPGGKAMAEYPRMGLDAFCQKVLVIQAPDGSIEVLFNEMPAFAKLHYGDSALIHEVINRRMRSTLEAAIGR